jgi:gliding motility associated protien GldN
MDETSQKNLFAIMIYNFANGKLVGYNSPEGGPNVPKFIKENEVKYEDVGFFHTAISYEDLPNPEDIYEKINYLSAGIIKYYIQEVWYFNKTTSTFHNKIIAIAPFFDKRYHPHADNEDAPNTSDGIVWFPYDKLRPFLQEEFVKMTGRNITPLVNFDDFFTTRQFYGYIVKDHDLQNRELRTVSDDPTYLKQEQDRIENEILNFEQDLWNY